MVLTAAHPRAFPCDGAQMDDSTRLALCRAANAQVWAGEGGLRPGGAVAGNDDVLIFSTGLRAPYWNGGIVLRRPDDVRATLESVRAFFATRQEPYGCLLPDELTGPLRADIAAAGFSVADDRQPLMALEAAGVHGGRPPDEVEIRAVSRSRQIEEHVALVGATLGVAGDGSPGSTALLHDFIAPQVGTDGYLHLTGYVESGPVCVATGIRTDETIGIFGVGTLSTARGRGYGGAITRAVVDQGFATGARLAWLNPSPMARSAYAGLGFTDLPGWSVLLPQH